MGIGVTPLIGSCLGNSNAPPISILFLMGAQKECSDAVGVLVFLTWDAEYVKSSETVAVSWFGVRWLAR